uniref:Uncharacterized protein n=1 Tax=Cacopsylla melanoneura TaxID=428564 RepID=A0A8D9EMM3_9HEMI
MTPVIQQCTCHPNMGDAVDNVLWETTGGTIKKPLIYLPAFDGSGLSGYSIALWHSKFDILIKNVNKNKIKCTEVEVLSSSAQGKSSESSLTAAGFVGRACLFNVKI